MADLMVALKELLDKYQGNGDALPEGLRLLVEAIMELEVTERTGAERYQRAPTRKIYRNGYRRRRWDTHVGTIHLRIPKLRKGGYFPSFLEPRRRAERALLSAGQESYVHGVSTRKVDGLVRSLGLEGISESEVSLRVAGRQGGEGEGGRSGGVHGGGGGDWGKGDRGTGGAGVRCGRARAIVSGRGFYETW
jgi:transposase-like protein